MTTSTPIRPAASSALRTAGRTAAAALIALGPWFAAIPSPALGAQSARQGTGPAESAWTFAVVTNDDVYLRCGPGDTYYPMGRLRAGDVVVTRGDTYGWMRVHARGPAFRAFFGYIRAEGDAAARLEFSGEPNVARTVGRVDLLAPNLNTAFRPRDSWKRLTLLPNGAALTVLETLRDDTDTVYKVALPEETEVWISAAYLQPATRAQYDAFVARSTETTTPRAPSPGVTPGATPGATPGPTTPTPGESTPGTPPTDGAARPLARETPTAPATTPPSPGTAAAPGAADRTAEPGTPAGPADATTPAQGTPAPGTSTTTERSAVIAPSQELESLEAAFAKLQNEPIESAEVLPLRDLYRALSQRAAASDAAGVARYADRRAEQLTVWGQLQERRQRLLDLEKRLEVTTEDVHASRTRAITTGTYTAVGRLMASTIFEGQRLPRLLRLQEATTGRTLAYLKPDDAFDLAGMLGQTIGVVGERSFDPGLRIDMITPRRIDLLVPDR